MASKTIHLLDPKFDITNLFNSNTNLKSLLRGRGPLTRVLFIEGDILHVPQSLNLSRSKLHIDYINSTNNRIQTVPHHYRSSSYDPVRKNIKKICSHTRLLLLCLCSCGIGNSFSASHGSKNLPHFHEHVSPATNSSKKKTA